MLFRLGLPIVLAGCWAGSAAAEPADIAAAGQVIYSHYCASCHGVSGRGNGPVAEELQVPPPDLTRLSERYGLPLPRDQLAETIDGRRVVEAHGPRDMPVWGRIFFSDLQQDSPDDAEAARRQAIEALIDYLVTIQRQRSS